MKAIRLICAAMVFCLVLPLFAGCSAKHSADDTDLAAAQISVGDHIFWGSYPQETKDPEPIEWRVLEITDGKALVVSEKLLDCKKYNSKLKDVTWEKCSLRKWLNKDFLNDAFTKGEQSSIVSAQIENHDNTAGNGDGGKDTKDRIFCLSLYEATIYFAGADDMVSFPTPYAVKHGSYEHFDGQGWYWLRTPGYTNSSAVIVNSYGETNKDGCGVDSEDISVRPAMWLKLR